jgi:hypothetical protein
MNKMTDVPYLYKYLEGLTKIETTNYEDAFKILCLSDNVMPFYSTALEFKLNNIGALGVAGDCVFYDVKIDRKPDILNNFRFENVHHYAFISNDVLHKNFPEDIVACSMPYSECFTRLYFKQDGIPSTFKISYDSLFVHTDLRKKLQVSVHTDHHIYKDGLISEKEMQSL